MGNTLRVVLLAIAALIVFFTGVLLTRAGRPYGSALLTVHKLVDVAAVVFIVVQAVGVARGPGLAAADWVLLIAALVVVVATFVSGGVVSISDSAATWLVTAHRWLPWPMLVLLAAVVYRFAGSGS